MGALKGRKKMYLICKIMVDDRDLTQGGLDETFVVLGSQLPEFPANLTLTVPGTPDGFPAFTGVAMPPVQLIMFLRCQEMRAEELTLIRLFRGLDKAQMTQFLELLPTIFQESLLPSRRHSL
jgi:hypothetical protein